MAKAISIRRRRPANSKVGTVGIYKAIGTTLPLAQ